MNFVLQPWNLIVTFLSSWINHQQQEVIEDLHTENALLNDDQQRRLAVKGKTLGRKILDKVGSLFTQDPGRIR